MRVIKYPKQKDLTAVLQRPVQNCAAALKSVQKILDDVKRDGDAALKKYSLLYDKICPAKLKVSQAEITNASKAVDKGLKNAIEIAYRNIYKFHEAQKLRPQKIETTKGVTCWRESRPIQNVGLYIPGGSAPLFSTVLMLAAPAQIAGCPNVSICTPPNGKGGIHPAILFAAQLCGVDHIYKAGGAQAIAAMAYGTESISSVDKIFGPGNSYVMLAKQLVQNEGIAIDMPAGPSEVLVVADETCDADFVAADLLSQAEHGPDSQVILIALNAVIIEKIESAVKKQLQQLPRRAIADKALRHSKIILVHNPQQAVEIINQYAPEHLIIAAKNKTYFIKEVFNAGSVFIGNYTPESAGDYASGTNHTLPTNGFARVYGGVSVNSFVKKITYQQITAEGLQNLGRVIETMAAGEQLEGHKNAVSIRLQKLKSK